MGSTRTKRALAFQSHLRLTHIQEAPSRGDYFSIRRHINPGGGTPPGGTSGTPRASYDTPPTSGLNLLGKVESWKIGPATTVHNVTLKLDTASGAQLLKLLRNLPDGMTYGLSLQKEED